MANLIDLLAVSQSSPLPCPGESGEPPGCGEYRQYAACAAALRTWCECMLRSRLVADVFDGRTGRLGFPVIPQMVV